MNTTRLRKTNFLKVVLMAACVAALLALAAEGGLAAPSDTTRVSVDSSGVQANSASTQPSFSADGRYVTFMSEASNLVENDTNGVPDVFVHDRQTGETERVSVDNSGTQANQAGSVVPAGSTQPSLSADGRYVAFGSYADNLVADDTNGHQDIFVHDQQTGETKRVNVDSSGAQANGFTLSHSISGDGRYVGFDSVATNLVADDTNGHQDIFVHELSWGDASPPTLSIPSSITVEADRPEGAVVVYDASANDEPDGSLIPTCSPASGSTFSIGVSTVNCAATDAAGNTTSGSFDVIVKDTTAPTLNLPGNITKEATGPTGATVNYNPAPTATDRVDGDLGSDKVTCDPASGSTFPIGATTVTCTANDSHNNTGTGTFKVNVVYAFGSGSGGSFGEPVRDLELNQLAAGASVPVKFGLGGDDGLNIFAAGYPTSKQISCPKGLPPDMVEETSTLSKSGLTYDATSGLYTYVWKTDRTWKGTCRELNLKLADGSDHRVQFQFT